MNATWNELLSQVRRCGLASVFISLTIFVLSTPAMSAEAMEQQQLVDKAKMTMEAFAADPGLKDAVREWKDAKGLFIVPELLRGAFVFGGAGGSGVLLVHDEKTGEWSQPAFYTIGAVSFGLQAGGDTSELIFVVRTQKGLEEFYRSDFKLGAGTGLSIGPVGGSSSFGGVTADILSYGRTKGAFVGMALDGARIAPSDQSNALYYGKAIRPVDILVKNSVSNPKSADLRAAAADLMR